MTFTEGGKHTKVQFDGQFVTTVPRHREVNERTVRSILNAARRWEPS